MTLRRPLAVFIASLGLLPALAASRPACCAPKPVPSACCAAMKASAPKGCCKAPAVPKSEARANPVAPALMTVATTAAAPVAVVHRPSEVETVRLARHEHRAPAPTDSPPDRCVLHQALLI
jgi:hypothetical protein